MSYKEKYNIAVIGATTNIGTEIINLLAERELPISNLYAVSSRDEIGKQISFGERIIKATYIEDIDFSKVKIAFFCSSNEISRKFIPIAIKAGCLVIDKSDVFLSDENIPIIVPEVNQITHSQNKNLIITPTSCCVALAIALKPLDNAAKIKRLVASTYQSTSGAGKEAMDELYHQTKSKFVFNDKSPEVFPKQIAFNIFPHIGEFDAEGNSLEEERINFEFSKVMGREINAAITCARVPVFLGHSISANIEFENNIDANEAYELLSEAEGVNVLSMEGEEKYLTPVEIAGDDNVYVCRIRNDLSRPNSLNLWITFDNLRRGSALNAVQIAEELLK